MIPVRELFQCFRPRFKRRLFALLVGHIDESGSDKTRLFTLSCILTSDLNWGDIEADWLEVLSEVNSALEREGRKKLSRYHSTYCANYADEFEGWNPEERIDFLQGLLAVFEHHNTAIISYTVNLRDISETMPDIRGKAKEIAYIWFLQKIMVWIGNRILDDKKYDGENVVLIHDRTPRYDCVLLDAFNAMKDDESFKHRKRFVSLAPMGWEDCVPLQPADFIAFESFKIIERKHADKPRHKVMDLLLDLKSIGGTGIEIPRHGVEDFNKNLTIEQRRELYRMARIPRPEKRAKDVIGLKHEQISAPAKRNKQENGADHT